MRRFDFLCGGTKARCAMRPTVTRERLRAENGGAMTRRRRRRGRRRTEHRERSAPPDCSSAPDLKKRLKKTRRSRGRRTPKAVGSGIGWYTAREYPRPNPTPLPSLSVPPLSATPGTIHTTARRNKPECARQNIMSGRRVTSAERALHELAGISHPGGFSRGKNQETRKYCPIATNTYGYSKLRAIYPYARALDRASPPTTTTTTETQNNNGIRRVAPGRGVRSGARSEDGSRRSPCRRSDGDVPPLPAPSSAGSPQSSSSSSWSSWNDVVGVRARRWRRRRRSQWLLRGGAARRHGRVSFL